MSPFSTSPNGHTPADRAYHRISTSPEPLDEIAKILFTPECVGDNTFKNRPCLITSVQDVRDEFRCVIAPVTKFDDEELENIELTELEKSMFLPILPNEWDVYGRQPIQTNPLWGRKRAYQMLIRLSCSIERTDIGRHTTYTCEMGETC